MVGRLHDYISDFFFTPDHDQVIYFWNTVEICDPVPILDLDLDLDHDNDTILDLDLEHDLEHSFELNLIFQRL